MKKVALSDLETFHTETGDVNVIIETPRGSRNKLKYEANGELFLLHKVLPAGAVFPHDFGFIPSTLGEDGDPLDALVLMDEPIFPGNLVRVRLIGAIEAEQTEGAKTFRNDRLIAVASVCQDYRNVRELDDLEESLVSQIEHFFVSYNQVEGKTFKPVGRPNARQAGKLLEAGIKRFRQQRQQS